MVNLKNRRFSPVHHPHFTALFILILLIIFSLNPSFAQPRATFVVNTTADTIDANLGDAVCADASGQCSLRAAIQTANNTSAADTITLPAGIYTVTRLGTEDFGVNGDLDVLAALTIQGAGSAATIIDAGGLDGAIDVPTINGVEFDLYISHVTIRNASGASKIGLSISSSCTLYLTDSIITNNAIGVEIYGDADIRRVIISDSAEKALLNGSNSTTLLKNSSIANNNVDDFFAYIVGNFGTMVMDNMLITDNINSSTGGAIYNNDGILTITNSSLMNNEASSGGAIYNAGSLGAITLTKVIINGNKARTEGGGILNFQGEMTLTNVVITNNGADPFNELNGNAGGIYNSIGEMTIIHSTISGNTAVGTVSDGKGGGIYNDGDLVIRNTTISGNLAEEPFNNDGQGGGIYDTGSSLLLNNVTITNNTAQHGGGIYAIETNGITFANTIIAGNIASTDSPDCFNLGGNSMVSQGNNLIGNSQNCTFSAAGDQVGVNALLSPLADNGGFTQTHALQVGSPAINTGNGATCETSDQRFAARVGTCDKGAFEFSGAAPTATPSPTQTPPATATPTPTQTLVGTAAPTATITLTPSETPVLIGELLTNGGFETGSPVPNGWQGVGLDNDKQICDKPAQGKFFAHSGSCAFRFKAVVGISSNLSQKITAPSVATGNVLVFGGWLTAKNFTGSGKIDVKIKYQDGTKAKATFNVATGTYAYTNVSVNSEAIMGAVANVNLKISVANGSGRLIVDDFTLGISESISLIGTRFGSNTGKSIPLPTQP